jgi:hypothetical protein
VVLYQSGSYQSGQLNYLPPLTSAPETVAGLQPQQAESLRRAGSPAAPKARALSQRHQFHLRTRKEPTGCEPLSIVDFRDPGWIVDFRDAGLKGDFRLVLSHNAISSISGLEKNPQVTSLPKNLFRQLASR